ncbi:MULTISPECIES: hypothetical protein [unclassified Rhizobium]|uniref:hypothetical protein n=1 Tax=unclassified Rhizobium TaxID=2613769 RepID=UPI002167301A|nr:MULTISPECIES: hypothetical protein [unclassified Rhizobium]MCS3742604.1 hypothetical protein [Rhizobium sp. BK661]MCS4094570.1 hypothetical protein [Rhizobium sp. BK176]
MSYNSETARDLLARIEESRRDFERETQSRRRLLADIHTSMEARQLDPDAPLSAVEEAALFRNEAYHAKGELSDTRRELASTQRQLADARGEKPQGPPDELMAEIEDSWRRLYIQYAEEFAPKFDNRIEAMRQKRIELEAKARRRRAEYKDGGDE